MSSEELPKELSSEELKKQLLARAIQSPFEGVQKVATGWIPDPLAD